MAFTITDVATQAKRATRVSVFLDGEFWTGMPDHVAVSMKLTVGRTLTAEDRAEVEREVARESALAAALNLLSYRDRSRTEIRERLTEKGYSDGVIDVVLAELDDYGYVDDGDFAEQVIISVQARGKGRMIASRELRRKGVDRELADGVLDRLYPETQEFDVALLWATPRADLRDIKGRQKLTRQLVGRGFSWDVARDVIEHLLSEGGS